MEGECDKERDKEELTPKREKRESKGNKTWTKEDKRGMKRKKD